MGIQLPKFFNDSYLLFYILIIVVTLQAMKVCMCIALYLPNYSS